MSPSYLPYTIDGSEIDDDVPQSQGMSEAQSDQIVAAAAAYRAVALHFTTDLVGRQLTVTASNAPAGPVIFNFGDNSAEVSQQVTGPGDSANAVHTYAADGTYTVGIRAKKDRYFTDVAVNWPPYPAEAPA